MKNLKNKILNILKEDTEENNIFEYLQKIQNKILKNYSSELFSNEDKNKLLAEYSKIGELGKKIYKYLTLKANNLDYTDDIQDIEDVVLKGGISNFVYIWNSENTVHTCDECASLDGTEYTFEDDIPDRPHPNCKCTVDIVEISDDVGGENSKSGNKKEEEPCDCWEKIDNILCESDDLHLEINSELEECMLMQNNANNFLTEVKQLKQKVINLKTELKNIKPCGPNCEVLTGMAAQITDDTELENKVYDLIENVYKAKEVYEIFLENKHEMQNTADGFDKYYHAKANCESAELGLIETMWSILYSIGKEIKDFKTKVFDLHWDIKKVYEDCMNDLKADLYGLTKAKEHGSCSDKVKDVGEIFK